MITIELNPYDVMAYFNRDTLYLKSGNNLQAIEVFQTPARPGDKQVQDYFNPKGIGW